MPGGDGLGAQLYVRLAPFTLPLLLADALDEEIKRGPVKPFRTGVTRCEAVYEKHMSFIGGASGRALRRLRPTTP